VDTESGLRMSSLLIPTNFAVQTLHELPLEPAGNLTHITPHLLRCETSGTIGGSLEQDLDRNPGKRAAADSLLDLCLFLDMLFDYELQC